VSRLAGEWVGAAELKNRETAIFPEYEYWLGGVYVVEKARGQGDARRSSLRPGSARITILCDQ
jgi:hypothetical protein